MSLNESILAVLVLLPELLLARRSANFELSRSSISLNIYFQTLSMSLVKMLICLSFFCFCFYVASVFSESGGIFEERNLKLKT